MGEVTRYLTTSAEVEALCKAAHAEGARQERERERENTIAIEGAGIRWDEVDADMKYEGRCVAVKIERGKAAHAAQLAALRGRCIEVTELVPACWPSGDGYSTTEQDVANDVAALIAERIEGLAIPDPTAALARVRAEAVREAIGRIDADLLAHAYAASDDTMDTAEGVEMFQKVLLNTLTPPAGEG